MFQSDTKTLHSTEWFDLFHPAYQEFLARSLARLCKIGIDGLVFLNDHPLGPYDGLTRIGVKRFEKQFGVDFDPSQVFQNDFDPLVITKKSSGNIRANIKNNKGSIYWRWAGWKARKRLTLLEELVDRLRTQYSSIQFGVRITPSWVNRSIGSVSSLF